MQINITGDLHTGMTEGFRLGLLLIPITVIPMLFVIGKTENIVGTVGLIVGFINTIVLIVPIFLRRRRLIRLLTKTVTERRSKL